MVRVCCVVAAGLVMAVGRPARAGDALLDEARHDVDSSDYLAARTALASALDAGGAAPAELAELYKLSGIVEAALGDAADSTAAFARWLAIDPKGTLPVGTSPKITRPFKTAADQAKQRKPLEIKAETSADPPTVTLVIVNDPVKLIARARVQVVVDGKPERTVEGRGGDRIAIELPRGRRLDLRIQALDEHGNRVAELGSSDVPIVITGTEREPKPSPAAVVVENRRAPPPHPRPVWARSWLWGGVAVAVGGGAAYFGFAARSATNELDNLNATSSAHKFTEALDVEARGRRDVLLFNIGIATAGVFAVGAAVLYLTAPHAVQEPRIAAAPAPGGGTIVVGGYF